MKPQLIDSHCHIDFEDFDRDRAQIIERSSKLGVTNLIVPAISQSSWQRTINTCEEYHNCHLALGLHPMFIEQHQPQHLTELDTLIKAYSPIAVGEIGLDYYSKDADKTKQRLYFRKQLMLAQRHHLPIIVHNRKAHDDCLLLINEFSIRGGIIHAFNGSIQQAEKYIEMGFLLGFGGMLTYERSTKLRALVKQLPLEAIVLETDAPDMTVKQHRDSRNSPEYIPLILDEVSFIKNKSTDKVAGITTNNIQRLFNILR